MGRKGGSYKFEKRQKEIQKKKRKRDKLARRQNKTDDEEPTPSVEPGIAFGEPADG